MKINYFEISRIPTVDAKKVLATIEDDERNPNRKRRRLDNLNVEERILRRKLKNRVAAQSARDRKKAHMDQLEITLMRVEKENKFLKKSNEDLRSQVHQLVESNAQLRSKLGLTPPASPSQDYTCLIVPTKQSNENIITPSVSDHDHIVIKKEELSPEHALLSGLSLLWNILMTTLVLMITMCKMSRRLNYFSILLVTTNPTRWKNPKSVRPIIPPDRSFTLKSSQLALAPNLEDKTTTTTSSAKNLMLMSFCQMRTMTLLARQALILSQYHHLIQQSLRSIVVSRCTTPRLKAAWLRNLPMKDTG